MLKLDQITKKFHIGTPDETTLFNQFCFEVQKGEFVSIVGSNGSGKTTLLNIVCGSLPVEGGKVFFGGKDITRLSEYKRADQIGRVFQDPKKGTCDELTILENMALADNKHKAYGLSRGVNKRRTDYYRTLLETCGMGLEDRLNVKAGTLSGGQRPRFPLLRSAVKRHPAVACRPPPLHPAGIRDFLHNRTARHGPAPVHPPGQAPAGRLSV